MSDNTENSRKDGNDPAKATRRRVLSAAGGLSLTGLLVAGADIRWSVNGDDSDRVEYVDRLKHTNPEAVRAGEPPKRTAVMDSVSRDHWLVVETAHDARDKYRARSNATRQTPES